MAQFLFVRIPRQIDPTSVKIRCFHPNAHVDEHRRRFDVWRFDRDPRQRHPHAGEHLAANFPGVMSTAPGVGEFRARKGGANRVYQIA